jgi:hypothetical protein
MRSARHYFSYKVIKWGVLPSMVLYRNRLLVGLLVLLVIASHAIAQTNYEGRWSAGPAEIRVSIQSWGPDCGKKPESGVKSAGGEVRVTQNGYHLAINSRDGVVRTDACWTKNPSVKRVSSFYLDGEWTVNCRTSADDPKEEFGEYSLRAQGSDRLEYKEVNRYNWKLNESSCVATVTVTQTLTRIDTSGAETGLKRPYSKAGRTNTTEEEPVKPTCLPSVPVQLVLRPQRAVVAPGERVCLRATLLDSKKCELPNPQIEWSLRYSKALRAQFEGGCFRSAANAADAEGEYRVIAVSGRVSAQAIITVRAVDLSDLIASRVESGAIRGTDSVGKKVIGAQGQGKLATRAVRVREEGLPLPLVAGAAGFFMLAVVGVLVFIMRKRTPPESPKKEGSLRPSKRPAGSLSPKKAPSDHPPPIEPHSIGGRWICPTCRRAYPPEVKNCPHDKSLLIPYDEFKKAHKAKQTGRRTRCPKCGATYSDTTAFCPQDGAGLVAIPEE